MKYQRSKSILLALASDGIENGMSDLPIGTFATVVTSSTGERHIGMFPNYVGYGKGKSICPSTNRKHSTIWCVTRNRESMGVSRR